MTIAIVAFTGGVLQVADAQCGWKDYLQAKTLRQETLLDSTTILLM